MRRSRFLALGIFAALAAAACSDVPVAPEPPDAAPALLELGSPKSVDVVRRTIPLPSDEVVSKTVGPLGGTLWLPQAGLTVVVPIGALRSPVQITVTAPAGNLVGYRFEPHGLVFRSPLIASQRTSGTELGLLGGVLSRPFVAYFQGDLEAKVDALEILKLDLLGLLGVANFQIPHFSGYVIATD